MPDLRLLAQRLGGLPEWPMREARLRDELLRLPPERIVHAVERILRLVRQQRNALYIPYISLLRLAVRLDAEMPHAMREWMYLSAESRHYWAAAFFSHPSDEEDPDLVAARPDAEIASLSLGERKARVRRATARDLERFFAVDHPHVVEILLSHPAMTDRLMVRYCARRPAAGALPLAVACHPRWVQFPDIIDALVQNPTVPQWLALKLLPLASDTALMELDRQESGGRGPSRADIRRWAGRLRRGPEAEPNQWQAEE